MLKNNKIYLGDCLEVMQAIDDKSIDMVLCDLPYRETGNKWDKNNIDLNKLFYEYERIIKDSGAIVLTGTFRFGIKLIKVAPHLYKYDWIWIKDNGTNAPNVNHQPFRIHEMVFVFGKGRVTYGTRVPMKYYPQKTKGESYRQMSGKISENWKGGLKNVITNNNGDRHPKTVQYFNRDRGLHPTQKPVALFEYLIKTYTNEYDLVLDNAAGSCTTAIASENLKRNWICIEKEEKYCEIGRRRIEENRECLHNIDNCAKLDI